VPQQAHDITDFAAFQGMLAHQTQAKSIQNRNMHHMIGFPCGNTPEARLSAERESRKVASHMVTGFLGV
jgi:hypothetical protein